MPDRRVLLVAALALPLAACEKAPYVEGGRPMLVFERVAYGSKRPAGVADTHVFEVSPASLAHPRELKAFFHWICQRGYVAAQCHIVVWPAGTAHARFGGTPAAATYDLSKGSGAERFTMYPNSALAQDW